MKKLIAAALAISMALLCCACGKKADDSDLSYIQKKGTLVVGITDYEPMDYQDENGSWTGFDAEFARAVAEKLGVESTGTTSSSSWSPRPLTASGTA